MPIRTLLPVLSLALCAGAAQAGTLLETVNHDLSRDGGSSTTINTWAQNGMMRVETKADRTTQRSTMIFKNDTIYAINHQEKSYYAMDRESMKRVADQLNPALKMLQERMKDMTPEQRAQMEKMMGGRLPGMGEAEKKTEIKRTARTDKVNGHSCSYVQVLEDGVLTDEMCVTPGKSLQGADEVMAVATRMGALLREMMSTMDAPWLKQMADKQVQNFAELGGIPVLSRHFEAGTPQSETTLTSIRSEALAASTFEIPAGYTQKDMLAVPGR